MPKRLTYLDQKRFDNVLDFMRALQDEDFTNEFDNSLVMRMLWSKVNEIKLAVKQEGEIYLTTQLQQNPVHEYDLIVTLHSKHTESVTATVVLYVRNEKIAVSTNVITEEIKPQLSDIPAIGATLYWFQAVEIFQANPRFNKTAFSAFKAVYRSVAPKGDAIKCRVKITPTSTGWEVEYKLESRKVLSVHFGYTS